jgi:hypothetical protein
MIKKNQETSELEKLGGFMCEYINRLLIETTYKLINKIDLDTVFICCLYILFFYPLIF